MKTALIVLSDRGASGERADACIPLMREKLGAQYEAYRRHVPRWIPRVTPWAQA